MRASCPYRRSRRDGIDVDTRAADLAASERVKPIIAALVAP